MRLFERITFFTSNSLGRRHLVFFFFVAVAAYLNTVTLDFSWDDVQQIRSNTAVHSLQNLPEMFKRSQAGSLSSYYRPVFFASLAADYAIWGDWAAGFHFSNIMLHALVSLLVVQLVFECTAVLATALFAGFIFTLHPIHAEAVSYVSARNELLCGLFVLSSFLCYIRFRKAASPESARFRLVLSFFWFGLALLSKETAITVPLLVAFYEALFGEGTASQRSVWVLMFLVAGMFYIVVRFAILSDPMGQEMPLSWRLSTVSEIVMYDLRNLFFPFDLKPFYHLPVFKTLADTKAVLFLAGLLATLSVFLLSFWFDRMLFFSLGWIIITLLPVSGIVTLIYPALIADRYMYLPSVGYAAGLGVLYSFVWDRLKGTGFAQIGRVSWIVLNLAFLVMVFQRNHVWKDDLELWTEASRQAPDDIYVMDKLALAYMERGDMRHAEMAVKQMIYVDQDNPQLHLKLANLYAKNATTHALAEDIFRNVITGFPEYTLGYNEYGLFLMSKRRFAEARKLLESSLAIHDDAFAHFLLGDALLELGELSLSEVHLAIAVQRDPMNADAYDDLGKINLLQGRHDDAVALFRKALELKPRDAEFTADLGKAIAERDALEGKGR